jgi:hypothetical protein
VPDAGRPLGFAFKKSSYSGGGGCVEVALSLDSLVLVRDTKDPLRRTQLTFSVDEWNAFIIGVKNGEFDLVDRPEI